MRIQPHLHVSTCPALGLSPSLFVPLAVVVAVLSLSRTASSQNPSSEMTRLVRAAAEKVLDGAKRAGIATPFSTVSVASAQADAKTWRIELRSDLASPFSQGSACKREPTQSETVCHVERSKTICSENALATMVAVSANQTPPICGGAFSGDVSSLGSLDRPPMALIFVLAHELGHILRGHTSTSASVGLVLRGGPSRRLRDMRAAVLDGASQLGREREADDTASRIVGALIDKVVRSNDPANSAYVASAFTTDLRLAFICVDEATRCRWAEHVELPPSKAFLKARAQDLVCRALDSKEGTRFPTFRGTHGDWGMRMSTIHSLSERYKKRYGSGGGLMNLVGSVDSIFAYWAKESQAYYAKLEAAFLEAAADPSAAGCTPRQ